MTSFVSLGQLCLVITKGTTPNLKLGGFAASGINYIKSESLSYDGNIDVGKFSFVSAYTHNQLKRSILREKDVLISIAGANLGKCGIVTATMLPANTNQAVAIIRVNPDLADARFVQLYLRNPAFVANSIAGVAQSAQPNLNLGDISRFKIPDVPLDEQQAIAATLGALDDKIALNRRTCATLEAMARALFRSWFVDFDPVHAKAAGEAPAHMDPATAALFPDRFGEDGLPKGWRNGSLADVAALNPEKWGNRNAPDSIEYVDLSNTKWGVIESTTPYVWKDAPSRARMALRPGDTIIGTVRPANGSFAYVSRDGLTGSTGFAVLRPICPADAALVNLAATDPDNIAALANLADGGAYPAVRPEVVAASDVVIAAGPIREAFTRFAAPFVDRVESAKTENRTLATLRDALLPKLMSGELRVREAEARVTEVA